MVRSLVCFAILAAGARGASAHPGHGSQGGSHELLHYLTEPVHLAPLLLAILAGMATAWMMSRVRRGT